MLALRLSVRRLASPQPRLRARSAQQPPSRLPPRANPRRAAASSSKSPTTVWRRADSRMSPHQGETETVNLICHSLARALLEQRHAFRLGAFHRWTARPRLRARHRRARRHTLRNHGHGSHTRRPTRIGYGTSSRRRARRRRSPLGSMSPDDPIGVSGIVRAANLAHATFSPGRIGALAPFWTCHRALGSARASRRGSAKSLASPGSRSRRW